MNNSQIKSSFGIMAKEYKKYRGTLPMKLYKNLFSLINRTNKNDVVSILDIGCGVGNSTESLLKTKNVTIIGCDIDERMIKEAKLSAKKNHFPITYVTAPAEKLPFAKESFDIAVSGAAFHWFATTKALREIQRILKPNGFYFVFWVVNKESSKPTIGIEVYKKYKWQGIPKELRDIDNVKNIFTKANFKNVQISKIPFSEIFTIPEIIGQIKTNSRYALLTKEEQKDFSKQMLAAYKQALGTKNTITNKSEICICWGYI